MGMMDLYHAIMNVRARTFILAVLLVVLVAASSNLALRPQVFEGALWAAPVNPNSAEAVDLRVLVPDQKENLEYGSQAEVFRFTLAADSAYTLRYLTLSVRDNGLTLPKEAGDWKLYLVQDGRPDFSSLVGYGEAWNEAFLKLRLSPSASVGFLGEGGKTTFALVSSVLKDSSSATAPWLDVSLPNVLPEGFDWAYIAGAHDAPWMDLNSSFGANTIQGLSSEGVTRH